MQSIKVSLLTRGQASSPLLIHIHQISFKSQSKSQSIVYYQIPFSFKYRSIEKLINQDLFLPDCRIFYKIVNFVQKTQQIVQDNTQVQFKQKDAIVLTNKTKDGFIEIKGTVINKAQQSNVFADISLKKIQGYQKFYEYRKKFKTLENITRKIQFALDHRIRMLCQNIASKEEFFFSMDELKDKQIKNWYIELVKNTKVTVFFQEIVKIGDQSFEKTIEQGSFYFDDHTWDSTYDLLLQFSQYLKITFALKMVRNKNLSKYEFVALRVLETSQKNQTIKIGNEQTIESLSGCIQLNPLIEGKYFDLEYGYLNQNLKQLQNLGQDQNLHKYLQRLTSSKQKYQHFINQKVLDLSTCKNLTFMINENMIQIPVTYLLQGYNSFGNQNMTVKFLLQVEEQALKQVASMEIQPLYQEFKPIPRKLYEIRVEDLLNIAQIPTIIQKVLFQTDSSFYLKIKCESTIYTAEFQISTAKRNEFKKESKELELKTEISKFIDGDFVLVSVTQNKQTLVMIKSKNLPQFYLVELTDTTPVTFNISTKRHVIMDGEIQKKQFYSSGSNFKTKVILSPNGVGNTSQKSVLCLEIKEIPQQIEGYSFNYKIKYRVSAPKTQSFESVYYELQVLKVQEQDLKRKRRKINKNKLSDKVQLQVDNGSVGSLTVKQFSVNRSCFVQKNPNLLLAIKLKKMHYNINLHTFDNDQLIEKQILLNRAAKDIVNQSTLTSELPTHHFRKYDFEAYDDNINQKVTLHLEIYCSKQPFSIGDQHMYHIKVPAKLWKMSNLAKQNAPKPKIQVQTYLSSKKNKEKLKGQLTHNSAQELLLGHFNASDGISVKVSYQNGQSLIGYSKIRECIKAKCNIAQDQIGWIQQSQWYFAVLNMESISFYFLIKMQFNASAERQSSNESHATRKTKSKEKKESSNEKGGPDLFAKTMKGFGEINKLKLTKNNLQDELRQLTAKYVQRQQTIIRLKKQIAELDEQNRKKSQELNSALQVNKKGQKGKNKKEDPNNPNKLSIYRSICECGQRNPQYMGYCEKCLQKLRQRYEIFFSQFQQKSAQYQKAMFQKFNLRDKIQTLKSKINAYKQSMNGDSNSQSQVKVTSSVDRQFSQMEQKQLALQIEELKLEIFDLERQRESEFQRRAYQMNELERKIKKEDDEMWQKSQQLNRLNLKLSEIKQQISQNTKQMSDD